MRFEQRIRVNADPARVWAFLWDIPKVAACVPGCREAIPLEQPHTYAAVVEERIGPFQVRFNLRITVDEMEEGKRIRATAQGKDSRVASQIKADVEVSIEPEGSGASTLHIAADVSVFGKLGTLGHGMIARRGDEILKQFAVALQARLGPETVRA